MAGFKGDFLGFYFNGIHSSKLGITRVASGDRYKDTLIPSFEDKSVDIPGNDGSYYYGMYYQPRTFSVEFATDEVTESQLIQMRRIFGTRKMHQLIFDEYPYKTFYAKLSSPPELSFICFDEGEVGTKERIYKGEGTLSFTCYHPFAHCTLKTVDDIHQAHLQRIGYEDDTKFLANAEGDKYHFDISENKMKDLFMTEDIEQAELIKKIIADEEKGLAANDGDSAAMRSLYIPPIEEGQSGYARETLSKTYLVKMIEKEIKQWAPASGICSTSSDYQGYDKFNNGVMTLYNPGDLSAEFKLYLPSDCLGANTIGISITDGAPNLESADQYLKLKWDTITLKDADATGVVINTRNHLIEEVKEEDGKLITTGAIRNDVVIDGIFFKIPPNYEYEGKTIYLVAENQIDNATIKYDYLYY